MQSTRTLLGGDPKRLQATAGEMGPPRTGKQMKCPLGPRSIKMPQILCDPPLERRLQKAGGSYRQDPTPPDAKAAAPQLCDWRLWWAITGQFKVQQLDHEI